MSKILLIFIATITARIPTKILNIRATISSCFSSIFFDFNGFTTSWVKATDAPIRKESAEDMTIAMTPAMTKPFKPMGRTSVITNGNARLGSISGLIVKAMMPIKPVMAKNGNEKIPLQNVPLAV